MHMRFSRGFTLIEVIIVVAIVGILASISVAFFGDNVTTANRTEARTALLEASAALEKCKVTFGTYNNTNCTASTSLTTGYNTENSFYKIKGTVTATTFDLVAAAQNRQSSDAECTTITLNNRGSRAATGTAIAECW